jgi:hypothetical protein
MAQPANALVAGLSGIQLSITGASTQQAQTSPQDPSISIRNRPARITFPLPRELRDKIYGYLLTAEHVLDEPWYIRPESLRGEVSNVVVLSRGWY